MTNTQTTHYNPGTTKLFALFVKGEFHRIVDENDHGLCEFMHCLGFERVTGVGVFTDRGLAERMAIALDSPTPFTVDKFLSYADKEGMYDLH